MYPLSLTLMSVNAVLFCQDSEVRQAALKRLQTISQDLQLTDEQKPRILPILMDEAKKIKAMHSDPYLLRNQKILQLIDIRNEANVRIKPVLTPIQQAKLDQMKRQLRQEVLRDLQRLVAASA